MLSGLLLLPPPLPPAATAHPPACLPCALCAALEWRPDGKQLAVGLEDGSVLLLNTEDGEVQQNAQLLSAALHKLAAPLLLLRLAVPLVAGAVEACQGPAPAAAAAAQTKPPRTAKLSQRRGPGSVAAWVDGFPRDGGPRRHRRHIQYRCARWR